MSFETFIAKRYLISKHKINFISIISFISVSGITIGVAALIVVLSVFNGFESLVTSFLVSFDPDIRIISKSSDGSLTEDIHSELAKIREVKSSAPFVSGKVLAYNSGLTQIVNLKGIDINTAKDIYAIEQNIFTGNFNFENDKGLPRIVLGLRLAEKLQLLVSDTLILISAAGIETAITQFSLPKSQKFIVGGIFSSNNNDYDGLYIFCSLQEAQKLFNYQGKIQGLDVRLTSLDKSFIVKNELLSKLDETKYSVYSWYDFHKELYDVMKIERWTAYLLLSLIIAVACFNILGSLSMTVIEKKRDIGVLRSMGVSDKAIIKIFMYEGLLIGFIGTLAGSAMGYFVCFLQLKFKIYPLDPLQYKIDALPLEIHFVDFFFIAVVAMLLSFIASLYPATGAVKTNIIEAIKWE